MTAAQKRARRQASRTLRKAQARYDQAPPGYRIARLRTLKRKVHEQLEADLAA